MKNQIFKDYFYMHQVIELARRGLYTTKPNPHVACLIVLDDKLLAKGVHQRAGFLHAEQIALKKLKKNNFSKQDLEKATLYVNLEPCNHIGKTPSCTEAIINSGIKRVVIASLDNNPLMNGKSVELLRKNGIECTFGVLDEQSRRLNIIHFRRFTKNIPYVYLKIACNLEGFMDDGQDKRVIITNQKSQKNSQKIRAKVGAIISTAQSVFIDNPKLTVRSKKITKLKYFFNPIRVLLDSNLSLLKEKKINIFNDLCGKVIIYHHQLHLNQDILDKFNNDIELRWIEKKNENLDLELILKDLMIKNNVNAVMFEAGAKLSTNVMNSHLADEIVIYLANKKFHIHSKNTKQISLAFNSMTNHYKLKKIKNYKQDIKMVYQKDDD